MTPESLLDHADHGRLWSHDPDLDVAAAYQLALQVRALRCARGEQPRGFKIGFTNRSIWPRYNVYAPIWGTVWDHTLSFCDGEGVISLARTCQPRIEPEVVFGLGSTPPPGATLDQLFEALDWIAPGFEVVQSHQADWKFEAAHTVADSGLHARLLVGQRLAVQSLAPAATALDARLGASQARLSCAGVPRDQGTGAQVLDGPLHALHHFLLELRACPGAPQLQAGDVVTTGTWTDAWPVTAGQVWSVAFSDALPPLTVRFAD